MYVDGVVVVVLGFEVDYDCLVVVCCGCDYFF